MADKEKELREFSKIEFGEVNEEQNTVRIDGYASVWDVEYPINGGSRSKRGFDEHVERGAFAKTLKEKADVRLLINHGKGTGLALARTKSNTLHLEEDEIGLRMWADLDLSNPEVQTLRSAMTRGDVDQSSFGFIPVRDQWTDNGSKRALKEVMIDDVTIATYPASEATLVKTRDAGPQEKQETRDAGTPVLDELRKLAEQVKK